VPWLKRRPGFEPGSVHVGFVMGKFSQVQVFLCVLLFSPVNIVPLLLHTHLLLPHEVCDSSDQAAHYHTLGPKLGASALTRHFAGTEEKIIVYKNRY
jgi:hypothetical protein